jgi:PAS domain S-box-containing protein
MIIIAMIASSWYLGLGPGLLLAIILEITLLYFGKPPLAVRTFVITFNRLVLFGSVVWFASSRRKAEKKLREQSELLQVTLSSIGDAVIATDINGKITFLNPTAQKITGWSMAEGSGRHLDDVFQVVNEDTGAAVDSPFAAIKRDGIIVGLANHSLLITKAGARIPIEDSGAPIRNSEGKLVGSIIVFHDVSERRRAEREREVLLERAQAARAQAETSDRLKDEFLATVSHELRTPLSAILGWAAMLNLGTLEEEATRNALAVIERNAKAQAEIIKDILDVSRIISGKLRIDARPVDLGELIRGAAETLQLAARAKSISIDVSLDSNAGLVAGDPDRLQQIVWNLLANAIKFTPTGGHAEIKLSQVDDHLEILVSDDGAGISPEFLPHVFERFRQADSSTTRSHGGLGLGLAIVRHLVELHGGTVSAASPGLGQGSRFTLRLPLANVAELAEGDWAIPVRDRGGAGASSGRPNLAGLKVLLVDDEPDTLEILTFMLNQFGARVRGASSAADAIDAFREWQPEVLVSDLGMPDEDGFDLIGKIRAMRPEEGGDIPAAALTAHVREEDRLQALAAGYQSHITKPVDPFKLATVVAGLDPRNHRTR